MDEAPLPINKATNLREEDNIIPDDVILENNFSIIFNNKSYLLTISKTNKSILFKLKSEYEPLIYYDFNYNIESLNNLSKFFSFYESIDQKYKLLIENLNYKDIKIEIEKDYVKIQFSLNLPLKKENVEILLYKKEINLNILLNKLKLQIEDYQQNQNKINELIKNQNYCENEINKKIKDFEEIIKNNNNYNNSNRNKNPIKIKNLEGYNNDKNKYNIDNTKKEFNELKNKFINYKNTFTKLWEELNINKNFQKEEEIKFNQEYYLQKLKNSNKEEILNEIEKIQNNNYNMKQKINENENIIDKLNQILVDKEKVTKFKIFKTISSDLFKYEYHNNKASIFCSFKDDNIYIVYGVVSLDLECYDVINENKFILIKQLHKKAFNSCRYFFDEKNKRDLIITSSLDNHVKIVNFKKEKSEIIDDFNFETRKNIIIDNSFLLDDKIIMIPFSFYYLNQKNGTIQFYNINNNNQYIGKIPDIGFILGLNKFYYKKNNQYYILISNIGGIFVYDVKDGKSLLYHKFIPQEEDEKKEKIEFCESKVYEKDDKLILIGPCLPFNYLYFWDFFDKNLIKKMEINYGISDICLWNNDYIYASLVKGEAQFILINLNNYSIEKNFHVEDKDQSGCGIKIFRHKSKGDYLISISITGKLSLYKIYE